MRPGRVGPPPAGLRLQSLLLVEEKLLEAKYFVFRIMRGRDRRHLAFDLNAFLSAARSVPLLLRKEMARVPGFRTWWIATEASMEADAGMRFFRQLRNFSQKEGRVRVVSFAHFARRLGRVRWRSVFEGGTIEVPAELIGRDLVDACRCHLAKLARIVLACASAFPFHTCPRRTLTVEGVEARDIRLDEVEALLGFPPGWTDAGGALPLRDRLDLLGRHLDAVDLGAIEILARYRPRALRMTMNDAGLASILAAGIARSMADSGER